MPKLRFDQWISLLILGVCLLSQSGVTIEDQLYLQKKQEVLRPLPKVQKQVVVPFLKQPIPEQDVLASLSATAVYVMDRDSGVILYQKNATQMRYPASTAKMMTALVARSIYPLDRTLKVDEEAYTTGTIMGVQVGEEFTVENLLAGLLISSGNDTAFVLANNHVLGYRGFVHDMNQKAKELHLEDTFFGNPSGLDKEGQQSTARDLAILGKELMKDEVLREIVGTKEKIVTDASGTFTHPLFNRNQLLGEEGVVGIKTGTTDFAGENLVTQVNRDGREVIFVVLGSQDRYTDTRALIEWVFANYDWKAVKNTAR